jgi:hypothetical protein
VNHPNLVKLLGYCSVDGKNGIQRLLVYEFMPNRSLEDHLFSRSLPLLPWKTRLQIMLGAAQGLQYLHEGLEIQVSTLSLCKLIMTIQNTPSVLIYKQKFNTPSGTWFIISTRYISYSIKLKKNLYLYMRSDGVYFVEHIIYQLADVNLIFY